MVKASEVLFTLTNGGGDQVLPILTDRAGAGKRIDLFDDRGLRAAAIGALNYWIVYGYRADVLGRLVGQVSGDADAALAQCKLWLADGTL